MQYWKEKNLPLGPELQRRPWPRPHPEPFRDEAIVYTELWNPVLIEIVWNHTGLIVIVDPDDDGRGLNIRHGKPQVDDILPQPEPLRLVCLADPPAHGADPQLQLSLLAPCEQEPAEAGGVEAVLAEVAAVVVAQDFAACLGYPDLFEPRVGGDDQLLVGVFRCHGLHGSDDGAEA